MTPGDNLPGRGDSKHSSPPQRAGGNVGRIARGSWGQSGESGGGGQTRPHPNSAGTTGSGLDRERGDLSREGRGVTLILKRSLQLPCSEWSGWA